MRFRPLQEMLLVLFIAMISPGVFIALKYYVSIDYVPTVSVLDVLYVLFFMSFFFVIPVFTVFAINSTIAFFYKLTWSNYQLRSDCHANLRDAAYYSVFISVLLGAFISLSILYLKIESNEYYSCILISACLFVLILSIPTFFPVDYLGYYFFIISVISVYTFSFFVLFYFNYYYYSLDGVVGIKIEYVVPIFVLSCVFAFSFLFHSDDNDILLSLLFVFILYFVMYVLIYGAAQNHLVKKFLAAENIQVVYQDKTGCELFIGGSGRVIDGVCSVTNVNILSNLGDYYLFEKDGTRYEVMKEKGIRLIFPEKSESKAEAKPESDKSGPTEDKEKDAK